MVEDIFERAEIAQESTEEVEIKNYAEKYHKYMKDLLGLGKVKMTDSRSGYKRFVAEKTYEMVSDLPDFEDNPQDGVWKDKFMGNDGNMRYVVYFMKNADIELAITTAIKVGLPSPAVLEDKVDRLAGLFA